MGKDLILIIENPEQTLLSLKEVCAACHVDEKEIIELVHNDIIVPRGRSTKTWKFSLSQLKRIRTALRLAHDFELEYAAVALVLDLLDRIEAMRGEIDIFERHFL